MFRRTVAPGIELRHLEFQDAAPIFALVERNRNYLREWLPWVDHSKSSADVLEFIRKSRTQFEENQSPSCAIWAGGAICGSFGCHVIDWSSRNCSVGYWIDPACSGRGIVTACCTAILDYLFGDLGLHRVEIRCGTGNAKSCAIPERIGFHREGVAREAQGVSGRWVDLVFWSMLEDQWKSRAT